MAIYEEFVVRPDHGKQMIIVSARDSGGTWRIIVDRINGGLVVVSPAEAKQLALALCRAIEALEAAGGLNGNGDHNGV
jgi:hypothetical protein